MRGSVSVVLQKYKPVLLVAFIVVLISFLTRLFLSIYAFPQLDGGFKNWAGIFLIGLFYDLCFAAYLSVPVILLVWFTSDRVYRRPYAWIVAGILVSLILAVAFFNLVPKELNAELPKAVLGLLILLLLIFLLLWSRTPEFRQRWRRGGLYVLFFLIIFLLLFNAVSEFLFWDEFGTRYNFIAVDYLIYTHEVAGNIQQSYPVIWIVIVAFALTLLLFWPMRKHLAKAVNTPVSFPQRSIGAGILLLAPLLVYLFVNNNLKNFSNNYYVNQLAGNGVYEFGAAYWNNDLDFYRFYKSIPDKEALTEVRKQLLQRSPTDKFIYEDSLSVERDVTYVGPEKKMNVVMISVESLSASFMKFFGYQYNVTPALDSLANHSMFFTNFYATGTRTVRGMEVLSLAIPPIPGQSVVRRPDNEGLFTIGAVLRAKGYITQFLYGGYSSFDNMGYYFRNNGYDVYDRSALRADEIHYANIWGVADEDMFTFSLKKFDENYARQKPFFAQIMTVSNHRPYTYPEGRIDISPQKQIRDGAVKYTDYAIGRFLKEAATKPWFANTIFVIVADHCAYAAGKSALPVTGYHIPLLIYAPGIIQPQQVTKLCSQIDLPPTIMGLLNMSYRSKFFGQDILRIPDGMERAFISTYQGLGYIRNGQLVVQQPPRLAEQQTPDFTTGNAKPATLTDSLYHQAVSYYQLAEKIYKSGGYKLK